MCENSSWESPCFAGEIFSQRFNFFLVVIKLWVTVPEYFNFPWTIFPLYAWRYPRAVECLKNSWICLFGNLAVNIFHNITCKHCRWPAGDTARRRIISQGTLTMPSYKHNVNPVRGLKSGWNNTLGGNLGPFPRLVQRTGDVGVWWSQTASNYAAQTANDENKGQNKKKLSQSRRLPWRWNVLFIMQSSAIACTLRSLSCRQNIRFIIIYFLDSALPEWQNVDLFEISVPRILFQNL